MSRSNLSRRAWACGSALALVLMALAAGPAQAHHPRGLRDLAPRPAHRHRGQHRPAGLPTARPTPPSSTARVQLRHAGERDEVGQPSRPAGAWTSPGRPARRPRARPTARSSAATPSCGTTSFRHGSTSGNFTDDELRPSSTSTSPTRSPLPGADLRVGRGQRGVQRGRQLRDTPSGSSSAGPGLHRQRVPLGPPGRPEAKLYNNDYNLEGIGRRATRVYELVQSCAGRASRSRASASRATRVQYPAPRPRRQPRAVRRDGSGHRGHRGGRAHAPSGDRREAGHAGRLLHRHAQQLPGGAPFVSFTVWGFDDKHSSVPTVFAGEGAATPFDESYQPKPAYFALRDALTRHRHW